MMVIIDGAVSCTAHLPPEVPGRPINLGIWFKRSCTCAAQAGSSTSRSPALSRVISPADIFNPCHSAMTGTLTSLNSGFHLGFAARAGAVSEPGSDGRQQSHQRFNGRVRKNNLDRFRLFANAAVHRQDQHRGVRCRGLQIAAVIFMAEQRRLQPAHFRPVIAPFADDQRCDLVNQRDFDLAQFAAFLGHLSRPAQQTIHERQTRAAAGSPANQRPSAVLF